jgi:FAD/FMN-containing dehydrogenase
MQSNNDFGVASTFSVNAHGWAVPFGPAGSTVRRMKLLTADGDLIACSRHENAELFRLAMGGYGLFGILTELELEMVPNVLLDPSFREMPAGELGPAFADALSGDSTIQMAYGRLNVDRDSFFSDGLLITYRPADDQTDIPAAQGSGFVSRMSRHMFRAQLGNEPAKRIRWGIETTLAQAISGTATRNSLLNEPVVTLDDRDPDRTDILHEYFVSPKSFPAFIEACREVIPASYQELLNVTLRFVAADRESVLSFAPGPRIAAVMLFSQEMTARAESDMRRMTQALIERVVANGGAYYLPYRPHASRDQFVRAYPRAREFAAAKRRHDPGLIFRNNFWDGYFAEL